MLKILFQALRSSQAGLYVYTKINRRLRRQGQSIFIACTPKSGSTFVSRTIMEITGFKLAELTYAYERNEQELYLPKLIDAYASNSVTQQHLKATEPNLDLMYGFGIRPVILVRNIFDSVVSARDHLLNEGVQSFPSIYATDHFAQLSEHDQYEFLILNAVPWYFNFYASWTDACATGKVDALWLTYEDLILDWPAGIQKILAFYGIEKLREEIIPSVEKMEKDHSGTRFNKGVTGRGLEKLSESQRAAISRHAEFYPWVDFSAIGVPRLQSTVEIENS